MNQDHMQIKSVVESSRPCGAEELARRGLRATRQRLAILDALCATKTHPTAEQLFMSVNGRVDGMSLATVYNTLEAFCRVGLAMKIPTPCGTARYDATTDAHVHARVLGSGEMLDVPETLSNELLNAIPSEVLQRIELELGVTVKQINVELEVEK